MFHRHGKLRMIRSDNGREFVAASLVSWLAEQGVACAFIEKGRPQQNAYVERFNGTMRDEKLNGEEFTQRPGGPGRPRGLDRGVQRAEAPPGVRDEDPTAVRLRVEASSRRQSVVSVPFRRT